jgi:NAD-dependent DNA ligase
MPPEGTYAWNDSGVDIMALDAVDDLAVARLTHFFERLGAKGVSRETIELLHGAGYTTARKMLDAKPGQVAQLHGMGNRAAELACGAMARAAKDPSCVQLMDASTIFGRGFGDRKLRAIYDALGSPSIAKLSEMLSDKEALASKVLAVQGMGDLTTRQFVDALADFLTFARENALSCKADRVAVATWAIAFSGFRDVALEARLVTLGGRVTQSVTADTVAVVVAQKGEKPTGKVLQALKKGIKVMDRAEFEQFLTSKN